MAKNRSMASRSVLRHFSITWYDDSFVVLLPLLSISSMRVFTYLKTRIVMDSSIVKGRSKCMLNSVNWQSVQVPKKQSDFQNVSFFGIDDDSQNQTVTLGSQASTIFLLLYAAYIDIIRNM